LKHTVYRSLAYLISQPEKSVT